MRNVVDSSEIAHLWAHQTQPSARCSASMSFAGPNFYSYSAVIGSILTLKDGRSAYLITTPGDYSGTTSGHQSIMRNAIGPYALVFTVPSFSSYAATYLFSDPKNVLARWTVQVTDMLGDANKAREPKKSRLIAMAAAIVDQMERFAKFTGVKGAKFPTLPGNPQDLPAIVAKEHARKVRAFDAAAKKQARIAAQAKLDALSAMLQWTGGEIDDAYDFARHYPTLLRVKGKNVETSHGARFPVTHARRGLRLVDATIASGKEWKTNGHKCQVGHYQIDSITLDGTVYAGCHVVPFASINAIRPQLMK